MKNENTKPVKKGEIDKAFDALAQYLFEQYKKQKQADNLKKYEVQASAKS